MISQLFKPKQTAEAAHAHPPAPGLSDEVGALLAARMGNIITALGCLTANSSGAIAQAQRRLAEGTLTSEQAADLANQLHNAFDDVERACRMISRARNTMTMPADHNADGHHA